MKMNHSSLEDYCETRLALTTKSPRYFALHYVFPVQLLIGGLGNLLNLIILNSYTSSARTQTLLSSLAASDLSCLLMIIPEYLATFTGMARWYHFRMFYFTTRTTCLQLVNCFSAVSNWLTLAVTVERVVAIRQPILAAIMATNHMIMTVLSLFALAFGLTFYYHVWLHKFPDYSCSNVTDLPIYRYYTIHYLRGSNPTLISYVDGSVVIGVITIIALPMTLLMALNCVLLISVRQSHRRIQRLGSIGSLSSRQVSTERKMSLTVISIVASFIVFNCPSALLHMWHFMMTERPAWHAMAAEISNCLIITGKMMNFLLYCMSSATFRQKAIRVITGRLFCHPHQRAVLVLQRRDCRKTDHAAASNHPNQANSRKYQSTPLALHPADHAAALNMPTLLLQREPIFLLRYNPHNNAAENQSPNPRFLIFGGSGCGGQFPMVQTAQNTRSNRFLLRNSSDFILPHKNNNNKITSSPIIIPTPGAGGYSEIRSAPITVNPLIRNESPRQQTNYHRNRFSSPPSDSSKSKAAKAPKWNFETTTKSMKYHYVASATSFSTDGDSKGGKEICTV